MLLSIIIPVYHVEPFLADCLESLLVCNLADCEVILVLRDSQDRSGAICEEYQRRWPFIRIVKQYGTGLSNARNTGMNSAHGEHVMFIDSDDYIDGCVLNELIAALRRGELRADIIVTDYYFVEHPSHKRIPVFQIGEQTRQQYGMQFLPTMLRHRKCFWNVWRYIYRRSFLEEHHIAFLENTLSEDVDYTSRVFLAEPTILFSHSPFYFYNVGRGGSLMDGCNLNRLKDTVEVLSDSIMRMREASIPHAGLIAARFQFEYILSIAMIVEIDCRDRTAARELFIGYDQILNPSEDELVMLFRRAIRLFGIENCAWLLHLMKQLRRMVLGRNNKRR